MSIEKFSDATYVETNLFNSDKILSRNLNQSTVALSEKSRGIDTYLEGASTEITASNLQKKLQQGPSNATDLYPHLYDGQSTADIAVALALVHTSITDLDLAVEAYRIAQLDQVWIHLSNVFANLTKAHEVTSFNESFGAVVSFCRRATMSPDYSNLDISQLMILQSSLRLLYRSPMIKLSDASDVIEKLESAGWNGSDLALANFSNALLRQFGYLLTPSDATVGSLPIELELGN